MYVCCPVLSNCEVPRRCVRWCLAVCSGLAVEVLHRALSFVKMHPLKICSSRVVCDVFISKLKSEVKLNSVSQYGALEIVLRTLCITKLIIKDNRILSS